MIVDDRLGADLQRHLLAPGAAGVGQRQPQHVHGAAEHDGALGGGHSPRVLPETMGRADDHARQRVVGANLAAMQIEMAGGLGQQAARNDDHHRRVIGLGQDDGLLQIEHEDVAFAQATT
ncbi:hypothetical protein D3C87_1313430 [compost metagenome]